MNIIFGKNNADLLRENYIILDLETINVADKTVECYCLVDGDKIKPEDYVTLDHYKKLHQAFVDNLKANNNKVCLDLIPHLYGKFGGELDSFYQAIAERLQSK